ncbi:MAG: RagB/SusD family nutrient uptake outer membrane protein [Bacteroidota bacterium]
MKKTLSICFGSLLLLMNWSCSESFLETTDRNNINSESFYSNAEEMIQAVNATYGGLQNQGLYQRSVFFMLDFSANEGAATQNTQQDPQQLLDYTWGNTNVHIVQFWRDNYLTIGRANTVLDQLPGVENIDAAIAARIEGEAKFLRGLAYLNLVQNFGGVPLRLSENEDSKVLANFPASNADEVYAQVESDLTFAKNNLPQASAYDPSDRGRATAGAAQALLGRALVYQEKWSQAETELRAVVNSGEYELISLDDLILQFNGQAELSAESLFEVQFENGQGEGGAPWAVDVNTGWGGNTEGTFRPKEYGVPSFYNCRAAQSLIDAFEPNDPRLNAFFYSDGSDLRGTPYDFATFSYGVRKYADETPGAAAPLDDGFVNAVVIRYAEVLLLLAEALHNQGNDADAVGFINEVRRRADPGGTILADREASGDVRQFIIDERQVELCFELHRRIDVVRWGLGSDVFGSKFITGRHELFPIPQQELDTNTEMTQNPGY